MPLGKQKVIKYIHIRHWDYWFSVYKIGPYQTHGIKGVEFNLTDDKEGNIIFYHLALHTIPSLDDIILDNNYLGLDDSMYPLFMRKCHELHDGDVDYFIGSRYYHPSSNENYSTVPPVVQIKTSSYISHYSDIFIKDKEPLLPDTLILWLQRLSMELFIDEYEFILTDVPDHEMAVDAFYNF